MTRISSAAYVTAVLRFLQAYNAGDFDACGELLEPDADWEGLMSHSGREEICDHLETYRGRWGTSLARPEDFRESGGRVLMVVAFTGASAHTQRPLEERQSWICEMTDAGTIRRVLTYESPADALRVLEELPPQHVRA